MNLNSVTALILCFFSLNSIALLANYVTVVEKRPIMSARYCLPLPVFQFWPKLTHPAARFLCNSWATCYFLYPQQLTNSWGHLLPQSCIVFHLTWIISLSAIGWCLDLCHKKNTNASRRQGFSVAGPCLWNSLPVALRDRDISLVQFKRLLKTLWFV